MKLKVFYQGDAPDMRYAIDKAKELEDEGYTVEYLDWDDAITVSQAETYSIFTTPTYLLIQDDGRLVEVWQKELPAIIEVKNLMMR